MKKFLLFSFPILFFSSFSFSQITFQKTYGTSGYSCAFSTQQTLDGGYILAGLNGSDNVYLVKTNSTGNLQWSKSYTGTAGGWNVMCRQTNDGGYIITTRTGSFSGSLDLYLIKTTSNGTMQWSKTFGGTGWEDGVSVQQTQDGGFIIFGETTSFGAGNYDNYLVKTNSSGILQWTKTFGGPNADEGDWIEVTNDGGFITVGTTNSFGAGSADIYLIKTTSVGTLQWANTFGGTNAEMGWCVRQTNDGGYIIAGNTKSFGAGNYDVYLVKANSSGNLQWTKTFGSTGNDYGYSVIQTNDGGYVVTAADINNSASSYIIKVSSNGTFQWNTSFNGNIQQIEKTNDGGYIISDYNCFVGAYLIKTDSNGNTADCIQSPPPLIISSGGLQGSGVTQGSGGVQNIGGADYTPTTIEKNICSYTNCVATPVSICLTTVDSFSQNNIVVWDKPASTTIDSFKIYRDSGTGYIPVVTLPYSALSSYTDNVNPNIHSYDYKISAIDTAGVESILSGRHETMFLQVTQPNPPANNLTWNDYCGFPVTKYYILCDTNNTNYWVRRDSVNFGTNVYVDSFPPTAIANYRIEAEVPTPCTVSIKYPTPNTTTVKGSKSNSDNKISGAVISELSGDNSLVVYPNPNHGSFTVFCNKYSVSSIRVYNMLGDLVYQKTASDKKTEIKLPSVSAGIYHLQVVTDKGTANKKIVVE